MNIHPFTLLTCWLFISVNALLLPLGWPLVAMSSAVLLVLSVWPASRHRWRYVCWLMLPMALGLWLVHGGWLAQWFGGNVAPSADRQQSALALWLRLLIIFSAAQLWMQAVPLPQLMRALFASRLPAGIAYLLASPLLLAEQLSQQMAAIREAQLARGVPLDGNFRQRARALVAMLWPLVNGALSGLTVRSAALESRAFHASVRRTVLWAPADTRRQALLRWGCLTVLVMECAGRWLWF